MATNPFAFTNPLLLAPRPGIEKTGFGGDHGTSLARPDHGTSLGGTHGVISGGGSSGVVSSGTPSLPAAPASGLEPAVRPYTAESIKPRVTATPRPGPITVTVVRREPTVPEEPLPGEGTTNSFIAWGGAASFEFKRQPTEPIKDPTGGDVFQPGENSASPIIPGDPVSGGPDVAPGTPVGGGGFNHKNPKRDTKDEPDSDPEDTIEHMEEWRVVKKIKVENPEDENDWVEIERVEKIAFRNSRTGILNVFVLQNQGGNKTVLPG